MCRDCVDDDAAALTCADRLPEYLGQIYLFRELTEDQLNQVMTDLRTHKLRDGRWLFRQGENAERFYVVRSGQVALFRQSPEGRESIVAVVGTDELFGEEVLCLAEPRHDLNARAIGECTLLSIDRAKFRAFLPHSEALNQRLLETLYRRQTMLLDHIERLTLQDATQRVMAYLLAQVGGAAGAQRMELSLPKHTLAAHLSIQPETLSRILGRLKECEYIRAEGDELIVRTEELRAGLSCSLCEQRWGCPGPGRLYIDADTADPRAAAGRELH